MPANDSIPLAVQWELSPVPGGATKLSLRGELEAASTPTVWKDLEKAFAGTTITGLDIDASGLTACDSAGLSLLYFLSTGGMTPGATVRMTGLGPELEHLFR